MQATHRINCIAESCRQEGVCSQEGSGGIKHRVECSGDLQDVHCKGFTAATQVVQDVRKMKIHTRGLLDVTQATGNTFMLLLTAMASQTTWRP